MENKTNIRKVIVGMIMAGAVLAIVIVGIALKVTEHDSGAGDSRVIVGTLVNSEYTYEELEELANKVASVSSFRFSGYGDREAKELMLAISGEYLEEIHATLSEANNNKWVSVQYKVGEMLERKYYDIYPDNVSGSGGESNVIGDTNPFIYESETPATVETLEETTETDGMNIENAGETSQIEGSNPPSIEDNQPSVEDNQPSVEDFVRNTDPSSVGKMDSVLEFNGTEWGVWTENIRDRIKSDGYASVIVCGDIVKIDCGVQSALGQLRGDHAYDFEVKHWGWFNNDTMLIEISTKPFEEQYGGVDQGYEGPSEYVGVNRWDYGYKSTNYTILLKGRVVRGDTDGTIRFEPSAESFVRLVKNLSSIN